MAAYSNTVEDHRRKWDKAEFEQKAKERLQAEDDDDDERVAKRAKGVKREMLKPRDYKIDLDSRVGKSVVINKSQPATEGGGYYCNVCDCIVKDSINFLDHINGKKHQRNMGMSMKVKRATLDDVRARLEQKKQQVEEKKKDYDIEERMRELKEEAVSPEIVTLVDELLDQVEVQLYFDDGAAMTDLMAAELAAPLPDPGVPLAGRKRRNIRTILTDNKLTQETQEAQRAETERLERLEEAARRISPPPISFPTLLDEVIDIGSDSDDSDIVCLEEDDTVAGGQPKIEGRQIQDYYVDDSKNVADSCGRMLINVGHPPGDIELFVAQHLVDCIKPHQLGGVRFMYENSVENQARLANSPGLGCILAHSMGLGKSLQVIVMVEALLTAKLLKHVLIIVPVNTLQNWAQEFDQWVPKVADEATKVMPRSFEFFVIQDLLRTNASRVQVVIDWHRQGGVLILGYEMFRLLCALNENKGAQRRGRKSKATADSPALDDVVSAEAFAECRKALQVPGPDIVICDEGHRIKNMNTKNARCLHAIGTRRRIILTGYPIQNNLMEYWCMVSFVRPNFLGTKAEFANMFERPIQNGQCTDSTLDDMRLARYRIHVLTNMLRGFVQRRTHELLRGVLPPKHEFIVFLRKSAVQERLYGTFIHYISDGFSAMPGLNPLRAFAVCCKIWNHPDILYEVVHGKRKGCADLEGFDEPVVKEAQSSGRNEDHQLQQQQGGFCPFEVRDKDVSYSWARHVFDDTKYELGQCDNGVKFTVAFDIIEEAVLMGDKVLLFTQSLFTLDKLEEYLSQRTVTGGNERWKRNRNYFRLDGSTGSTERHKLVARFNREPSVHLFLFSTRAGCLGINLTSANRVIVFDVSWNPCHDAQAVCRVYRYGQTKPSFIYRLVTDNSLERIIYNRQIGKQGMSDRVVDERCVGSSMSNSDLRNLLRYRPMSNQDAMTPLHVSPEQVAGDQLFFRVCQKNALALAELPIPHDSLLVDGGLQPLSEYEKAEADRSYRSELRRVRGAPGGLPRFRDTSYLSRLGLAGIARGDTFDALRRRPSILGGPSGLCAQPQVAVVRPIQHTMRSTSVQGNLNMYAEPAPSAPNSYQPDFGLDHQRIITTDNFVTSMTISLPSVTFRDMGFYTVNAGTNVWLVRTTTGLYLRLPNGHVLDARGSIYDNSMAQPYADMHMPGPSSQLGFPNGFPQQTQPLYAPICSAPSPSMQPRWPTSFMDATTAPLPLHTSVSVPQLAASVPFYFDEQPEIIDLD